MEKKISQPDVTTKHGQFKSNRKSRREDAAPTVENLAFLEVLDEPAIVEQLQGRYEENEIYTYIGDILLAVNPFLTLDIYSQEYVKRYMHAVKQDNPPHIFAVADQSYQMMMHNRHSQCIVISGESGAGKTESANLLVQQLTQLGKASNRALEERILQVNPLMEAFGNAKTVINDNSSRFGKYLDMFFTPGSGTVIGAKITEYLLEKSRVINQAPGEQNFHIFYYIHDGLISSNKEQDYHLKPNTLYKYIAGYTNGKADTSVLSMNRVRFKAIEHCFEIIGFKPQEVSSVYSILAAILHTGNIEFVPKDSGYGEDACTVKNTELITIVSKLLGLDYTDLFECLTTTGMVAKGEVIIRNNSIQEATVARNAMVKALYGRLFSWIVNRISSLLKPRGKERNEPYTIGLLDIFGFENFKTNSFEQLCINIANEQIQYYFNQHIFAWELEEYKNEEVDATQVQYVDNRPILDMFLSKPVGLLALLDEESHFPKATDATLVDKFHQNLKASSYLKPRSSNVTFGIKHFAGKVDYMASGFLEKNRDRLPMEILNIMKLSENKVVNSLFQTPLTKTGNLSTSSTSPSNRSSRGSSPHNTGGGVTVMSYSSKNNTMGGSRHAQNSSSMTRIQQTVATYFRYSLMDLLNKMVSGTPHFVRCVKPNDQKEPGNFNAERVTTQLRYTGVLETTRIRRQGYSHRIPFSDFLKRYHVLGFNHDEAVSVTGESCTRLLNNLHMTEFAIGKSKVFLKFYHVEELAQKYEAVCQKIIRVQAHIRMWLTVTRVRKMKGKREQASVIIQKNYRCYACRTKYKAAKTERHEAATEIQRVIKGRNTRSLYKPKIERRREAAIMIQSNVRRHQCQKKYKKMKAIKEEEEEVAGKKKELHGQSATKIQKTYRGYSQRKKTKKETLTRQMSATRIQTYFRMWVQYSKYQQVLNKRNDKRKEILTRSWSKTSDGSTPSSPSHNDKSNTDSPSKKAWARMSKGARNSQGSTPSSPAHEHKPTTNADSPSKKAWARMSKGARDSQGSTPSSPAHEIKPTTNTDSPSKKAWERLSKGAISDTRVDQMNRIHQEKKLLPDQDANYYDAVNSESILPDDRNLNILNNKNVKKSGKMPEVVISGSSDKDFDMDEEVMNYMHSQINCVPAGDLDNQNNQSQSSTTTTAPQKTNFSRMLLAQKVADIFMANKPEKKKTAQGNDIDDDDEIDDDEDDDDDDEEEEERYIPSTRNNNRNKTNNSLSINSSWDGPLMSAKENCLAPDDYNEALNGRISRHSECSIEADLHTERENLLEEEDAAEMAKRLESELAGSILALWQQRLTQSSPHEDDIEIDYASESDVASVASTGPPSPTPESAASTVFPSTQDADNSRDQNGNSRPVNPMAPVKLPIMGDNSSQSNVALGEIRARLRKTKFDYSNDTRQRISDATPKTDYRGVLKKKGAA